MCSYSFIFELWFRADTSAGQHHSFDKVVELCCHVDLVILQLYTTTLGLHLLNQPEEI